MTTAVTIALAAFALYWLAIILISETPLGTLLDRIWNRIHHRK